MTYRTHLCVWYPDLSKTRKYRTYTPEAVNIETLKSIEIGGRLHALLRVVCIRSTSACSMNSHPPLKRLMRHTRAFWSGSNLALPVDTLTLVLAVFGGTGNLIVTFDAFR